MRARARALLAGSLVGLLLSSGLGCGGADPPDSATVRAEPVRPAPAPETTPVPSAPASTPTGPSIRVTDGRTVVAIDPATGGRRAAWTDAAISLEGNWTVAPGRRRQGQLVRRLRRARPHRRRARRSPPDHHERRRSLGGVRRAGAADPGGGDRPGSQHVPLRGHRWRGVHAGAHAPRQLRAGGLRVVRRDERASATDEPPAHRVPPARAPDPLPRPHPRSRHRRDRVAGEPAGEGHAGRRIHGGRQPHPGVRRVVVAALHALPAGRAGPGQRRPGLRRVGVRLRPHAGHFVRRRLVHRPARGARDDRELGGPGAQPARAAPLRGDRGREARRHQPRRPHRAARVTHCRSRARPSSERRRDDEPFSR